MVFASPFADPFDLLWLPCLKSLLFLICEILEVIFEVATLFEDLIFFNIDKFLELVSLIDISDTEKSSPGLLKLGLLEVISCGDDVKMALAEFVLFFCVCGMLPLADVPASLGNATDDLVESFFSFDPVFGKISLFIT
ncbi:unnamed protein product [[Candida] boidinii]|nr:unnamed protein product [[Candida] boidinii]